MDCIIDGHHGIYIPKLFAEKYGHLVTTDKMHDNFVLLLKGPDTENYWEIWEDVFNDFTWTVDGKTYFLYQDSDLFMIEEGEELPD